jgi:hypothetical protein
MSSVANIRQAVDDAALLLDRSKYQIHDKVDEIARILLAQAIVLELRQQYGLSFIAIGRGCGVSEKTIRYNWLGANDCPKDENLIALSKFYCQVVNR